MNETEKQNVKPKHETQNSRKYVYDLNGWFNR